MAASQGAPAGGPVWSLPDVLAGRPSIRVNQLGYLPGHRLGATLVSGSPDPVGFAVVRDDGVVVHEGVSRPWPVRPEPTSGLDVHVLTVDGFPEGTFHLRTGELCYLDEPTSEVTNDVCIRWNAPLVWVSALLADR